MRAVENAGILISEAAPQEKRYGDAKMRYVRYRNNHVPSGYEKLSQLALELQKGSATETPEKLQQLFDDFEREFASFRYKLESIRASTAPA